jgi:polyisoprenyl-phosphate glycosyltransferase
MGDEMILTVSMSSHNEEEALPVTIPPLVEHLNKLDVSYEVVLVDNGSTDRTAEVIDGFTAQGLPVRRVDVKVNRGYGLGMWTGVQAARGRVVCMAWSDGQVSSEDIAKVCAMSLDLKRSEMVKVQRVTRYDGLLRRFISKTYNTLFTILFGRVTPDVNGCPKILRREDWALLDMQSLDSFADAEIMIKVARLNFKITEVPVVFLARKQGGTKVKLIGHILMFLGDLIKFRVTRILPRWDKFRADREEPSGAGEGN